MAAIPSTMMPLGTLAPDFTLLDVNSGNMLSLDELKSDTATVIMFICNHCPYVKHLLPKLTEVLTHYKAQGVNTIAISANDVDNYPDDSPEKMRELVNQLNHPFHYLYDEDQSVAKAYQAACTPDFYIFDKAMKCVYRGRFDASTPKNDQPVTGEDMIQALDAILAGQAVSEEQFPSIGCNIKWK